MPIAQTIKYSVVVAQIAHKLDAAERALMLRSGADSEDYQRFMREESGNVASDGNFSLQVCCLTACYQSMCRTL